MSFEPTIFSTVFVVSQKDLNARIIFFVKKLQIFFSRHRERKIPEFCQTLDADASKFEQRNTFFYFCQKILFAQNKKLTRDAVRRADGLDQKKNKNF